MSRVSGSHSLVGEPVRSATTTCPPSGDARERRAAGVLGAQPLGRFCLSLKSHQLCVPAMALLHMSSEDTCTCTPDSVLHAHSCRHRVAPSVRGRDRGIFMLGYGTVTLPVSQESMLRLSGRRSLGQDHILGYMSLSLYDSDKLGQQASA